MDTTKLTDFFSAFLSGDHEKVAALLPGLQQPAETIARFWEIRYAKDQLKVISLLHKAAYYGWLDIVSMRSISTPAYHRRDNLGLTPLHHAAAGGSLEVIKYLITEQHCDPKSVGENKWTLLHYASKGGHVNTAQYLIELGCDPMIPCHHGSLPLHVACIHGHLAITKYFVTELKCNSEIRGQCGYTSLHYASKGGHIDIVQYLLTEGGCDPMAVDDDGDTVLHTACYQGHYDLVKWLLHDGRVKIKYNERKDALSTLWDIPEDVFKSMYLYEKAEKTSRIHPIHSLSKTILTGDHAAGKSTLAKAMNELLQVTSANGSNYLDMLKNQSLILLE